MTRFLALWFPAWAVEVLAKQRGWSPLQPIATVNQHRVAACNSRARRQGVVPGMRLRQALLLCPDLLYGPPEESAEHAWHEQMLLSLRDMAADVDTIRPGLVVVPMRGMVSYFGDEETVVERVFDTVAFSGADASVGVADGFLNAVWAAYMGKEIAPGEELDVIQAQPLSLLTREPALAAPAELVATLQDLGLRTIGDFAALPRADVAVRFGAAGAYWHRISCGDDDRQAATTTTESPILAAFDAEDEPLDRVEAAAFIARSLAAELHQQLLHHNQVCTRLVVRCLVREPGEQDLAQHERAWRCQDAVSEKATADKVRWQVEHWLTTQKIAAQRGARKYGAQQPSAIDAQGEVFADSISDGDSGIVRLELIAAETTPSGAVGYALWGKGSGEGKSARAAAEKVQALLGEKSVLSALVQPGRDIRNIVMTSTYGEEEQSQSRAIAFNRSARVAPARCTTGLRQRSAHSVQRGATASRRVENQPAAVGTTPGALPAPLPAQLHPASPTHPAAVAQLLDERDVPIHVTGRGLLSGTPSVLVRGKTRYAVTAWAGPWPVDDSWWLDEEHSRYARLQVVTEEPDGYLLITKNGKWRVEATY